MNRKRPIYIMLYRPEVEKTTILEGNKISRLKESHHVIDLGSDITWLTQQEGVIRWMSVWSDKGMKGKTTAFIHKDKELTWSTAANYKQLETFEQTIQQQEEIFKHHLKLRNWFELVWASK